MDNGEHCAQFQPSFWVYRPLFRLFPGLRTHSPPMSKTTDYWFCAIAPRALVEAAVAKLTAQLDYSNFKNQVAKVQGSKRAHLHHDVWDVLNRMQGDPAYEMKHKPVPKKQTLSVPKAGAYGSLLFDARGRTLLRKPSNHFGGYVWTFAKGKPDAGEQPEQTALREVHEETGYVCRVLVR